MLRYELWFNKACKAGYEQMNLTITRQTRNWIGHTMRSPVTVSPKILEY